MEALLRHVNIAKARWSSRNRSWALCPQKVRHMLEDSFFEGGSNFLHERNRSWMKSDEIEQVAVFLTLDEQDKIIKVFTMGDTKCNAIDALKFVKDELIKHGNAVFSDISSEWEL